MRKIMSIIHYEYKMQIKGIATWGVLLAVTGIALLDHFPSTTNLARLEFLVWPAYFIYRTMSQDGLILAFGLLFLLSSRFPLDKKTGVKSVIMASPVNKGQYIFGKLLGGFFYTFTMLSIFLMVNTATYYVAAPFEIEIMECVTPLLKTIFISAMPVSLFISFCSVAIPALIDIRLFYLLSAILFGVNAATVNSAEAMPFYLITSGDLIRLIWVHPRWPEIITGSVRANLIFLLGSGVISCILLCLKHKFWRAE